MKDDKDIFNIKQLLFTMIVIVLFCMSCVNDEFNLKVNTTEEIVIANEMETTIKTIGAIYREVEIISENIKKGQAIGVIINEEENKWEYVFDTDLLSGKVAVEYFAQNTDNNEIKNVDCSKLKIHYYENIWMRLFGSFTIENISVSQQSKKYGIYTEEFGYADVNSSTIPDIAVTSDYTVDYYSAQRNISGQIVFSGSGYGYNQLSGNHRHTITKDIKIDITTFNIIDGKMTVIIDKYGERFPVEIEYSESGRTVKHRDNEHNTYYSNTQK
ncbi:MAG: hypothetical protein LBH30_00245 [Prevotellaceae bacterium]|nr:hypothetical protein [Prevotellaceae bacterium]